MRFLLLTICLLSVARSFAQTATGCPLNIGFENGTFQNWNFYTGIRTTNGQFSINPPTPGDTKPILIPANSPVLDPYGKFPVSPPDKSRYSVMLGDDRNSRQVDGLSYTFTIPPGRNEFSITYSYAVVFSYTPSETKLNAPKFSVKVFDVAANAYIDCLTSEFSPANNIGYLTSAQRADVLYKPWSAASINLVGYADKTLRLDFLTADCDFATLGAGHFAYAYIDVNEVCATPVTGNLVCNADSIVLTAPAGFKEYSWYNSDLSDLLGTGSSIVLKPAPPVNSVFAVKLIPLPDAGCPATIFTVIRQGREVTQFIVKDTLQVCSQSLADLTSPDISTGSSADLTFSYFTDAEASEILENPQNIEMPGKYYIKAINQTGCFAIKPIVVLFSKFDFKIIRPLPVYFPYSVDLTSQELKKGSSPGLIYTYWLDEQATVPLVSPASVKESGTYYIKAVAGNCFEILPVVVEIQPSVPNTFSPNGDGVNDIFNVITSNELPTNFFRIFNRWGQLIFDNRRDGNFWDGTKNGKKQPPGAYYWVWEAFDTIEKRKITRTGTVAIVR